MITNKRVLVVEDDEQVAEVIEWNLFLAGYAVTVVKDGLAALHAFDEIRPALVTIDLNVPEVSGFRLVPLFKRHAPDVPVVVVTGSTFEEAEEIARAGADDFLTKPFDPYQLVQKVTFLLDHVARPRYPVPNQTTEMADRRLTVTGLA